MRQILKVLVVSLPLLVVAACSDVSTSPESSATRSLSATAPAFDYSGGGRFRFGDVQTSFTVSPDGGTYAVNRLVDVDFPASAICDPDLSSYGTGEWEAPCVTLTRPITITATTRLTANGIAIDFQPDLRFSPDKVVTLSTDLFGPVLRSNRRFFAVQPNSLRTLALLYSPSLGAQPVADYAADTSLVTHVDLETGHVWRRVKHFSGYVGGTGHSCNPSAGDPDCIAVESR